MERNLCETRCWSFGLGKNFATGLKETCVTPPHYVMDPACWSFGLRNIFATGWKETCVTPPPPPPPHHPAHYVMETECWTFKNCWHIFCCCPECTHMHAYTHIRVHTYTHTHTHTHTHIRKQVNARHNDRNILVAAYSGKTEVIYREGKDYVPADCDQFLKDSKNCKLWTEKQSYSALVSIYTFAKCEQLQSRPLQSFVRCSVYLPINGLEMQTSVADDPNRQLAEPNRWNELERHRLFVTRG